MARNIVLIGFMASGKTTLGRIIAETYGFDFLDTDEIIQERCARTVADIFQSKGEGFFRSQERRLLADLTQLEGTVLSCGGGIVGESGNRKILRELGLVYYLKASFALLWQRIVHDHASERPLAAQRESLLELYDHREKLYAELGRPIELGFEKPRALAARIVDHFRSAGGLLPR